MTFFTLSLTLFLEKTFCLISLVLILLLIIILSCTVRILQQNIQKLTTELHLAVLRNKKGEMLGAGALPMAKVMRKEAWHTQRRDQASGVSLEILEQSTPKTRVCLLSALCFHLHL